jgi:hypothetical protein
LKEIKEETRSTAIFAGVFLTVTFATRYQPGAVILGCLVALLIFFLSIMGKKIPWTIFMVVNPFLAAIMIQIIKQENAGVFDIIFLGILTVILILSFNFWALSIMNRVRERYYPRKPDQGRMKKRFFLCQGLLFILLAIISLIL